MRDEKVANQMTTARTINEVHTYPKERIEKIVMECAKSHIIDGWYVGTFKEQSVSWNDDGSITVRTIHTPVIRD